MVNLRVLDDLPAEATFKLAVRNERPVSSAELGEVFSAMARDYRSITRGRELMVAEVRTGSILATLADMAAIASPIIKDSVELAKAARGMGEFAHAVWGVLGRAKDGGGGVFEGTKRRRGQASAEALLKIAADADAEVELEQISPDGYATRIKVIPVEAVKIRENAATRRLMLEDSRAQRLLRAPEFGFSADKLTETLLRLPGPTTAGLNGEARDAVSAIVAAMAASGFSFALAEVARSLEVRGRTDLAEVVRASLKIEE